MRIRHATPSDLPVINDLYNHYVLCSTATYQTEPETPDQRDQWFAQHGPRHPITVAVIEDRIVGWASLSPFRSRSAYDYTVENSLYVHPEQFRRGIGTALLADLIQRAAAIGHRSIIAAIDAEQTASIALHQRHSFTTVAELKQVGFKFNRWLDVVYMQRML